ncbi:MAG: hypothetical protein EU541_07330 [Promethearchaeota archaeon]|nr:MAG: hypothetical protein EU541_07330 [Candidatus Lokiarchaeota archaeon]
MLDIILIQHIESATNLLEYRQKNTKLDKKHSDIFGGFLSAIQSLSNEINIGEISLISTTGENGHHCIIIRKDPINVILLVDQNDPIKMWRDLGEDIASKFLQDYGTPLNHLEITQFDSFKGYLQDICEITQYCEKN